MSIFRIQKNRDNPYVMLNKEFLNDEHLTWKAKGLLAYLLSLPDDWRIYEEEVAKHSRDGLDSLRSAIKNLTDCGYIQRVRTRDEKGRLGPYEYSVFEVPTHMGKTYLGKTKGGKTYRGKSNATNKPSTYNNSTNYPSTKRRETFNNFEQRDYDFDSLERRLLGWDKGEE